MRARDRGDVGIAPAPVGERGEERGVVLRPLQPFDPGARLEAGRHQPVGGLGHRRHDLAQPRREVAAEAHAIDPDHADRVLEMIDDASQRSLLVADRERVQHQAEQPSGCGEGAQLVVGQVARVVVDRPARRVGADHRSTGGARDDLVERRRRGVGEVEDHPEPDELVDERPAEPREPAVLGGAVGERVAAVPRQPRHAHAELPERLGRPRLVAELLDAFEREHQPDPLAALDRVEVGGASGPARPARGSRARHGAGTSPGRAPRGACPRAAARARRRPGTPAARRRRPRASGSHVRANEPVSPKRSSR